MASRMMHLAAASQLLDLLPEGMDVPRFLSGTIMVDSAPQERHASHFLTVMNGRKTYDIARFRELYGGMLLSDGLVLGYYLHLVQDLVFRDFMYHQMEFNPRKPGYLAGLHGDYRRLNRLLAERYALRTDFAIPETAAPLEAIAAFDMSYLPAALAGDLAEPVTEAAFFFTEDMAAEYIAQAVRKCREELHALRNGLPMTDPADWTWQLDPA